MILCNEFIFDSAHKLEDFDGKCSALHGHTYKLQICIQGKIQENGFVMDLIILKGLVKKNVLELLDHKYINDTIKNPTVENVTMWIWDQLKEIIPLYKVTLWETPRIFAIYSGEV